MHKISFTAIDPGLQLREDRVDESLVRRDWDFFDSRERNDGTATRVPVLSPPTPQTPSFFSESLLSIQH